MAITTKNAQKALDTYYSLKQLVTKRDKKLDRLLKSGKWERYQKRRKKLFPDYDKVIQKAANDYLKKAGNNITNQEKQADKSLSLSDELSKAIKEKSKDTNTAISSTESIITDCRSKLKIAKDELKSIDKIIHDIEKKRPPGDGAFTNVAKALAKTQTIKKNADKSLSIIQTKLSNAQKNKSQFVSNQQEIENSLQAHKLLKERLKRYKNTLKKTADALKKLEKAEKEIIIDNDLLEKDNETSLSNEIKNIQEDIKKLRGQLDKTKITVNAKTTTTATTKEANNIASFLKTAKEQWIAISAKHTKGFSDTKSYFAYYEGIKIYATPFKAIRGQATGKTLKTNTTNGYTFIDKKGAFREIENIGWCRLDDFFTEDQKNRLEYLNAYKSWLHERYTEMFLLKGQQKLDRIKGILSQSEAVIQKFNKGTSLDIKKLNEKPVFKQNTFSVTCPHELIKAFAYG